MVADVEKKVKTTKRDCAGFCSIEVATGIGYRKRICEEKCDQRLANQMATVSTIDQAKK